MLGSWLCYEDAHNTTKPDINQPDFTTVETNLSSWVEDYYQPTPQHGFQ